MHHTVERIPFVCQYCQKPFDILPCDAKRRQPKYCSVSCYQQSRSGWDESQGYSVCEKDGCAGKVYARRMCHQHYAQWQINRYHHTHEGSSTRWYWKNKELIHEKRQKVSQEFNAHQRNQRRSLKKDILSHYSTDETKNPLCAWCGFTDIRALCLDHIDNDGETHREALSGLPRGHGASGSVMYRWVKKNQYPEGFQVLCANCNLIKEFRYREENPARNVSSKTRT